MHSTLICGTFLSSESIRLGRFVRNIDEPQQDFLDPDCNVPLTSVIVKPHLHFEGVQHNAKDKSFTAMLTSLVSTSRTKRNDAYTQISTDQVITYQLSNSGSWFKSAVKSEAVHGWLNESIEQGDDIYVVVGYHTMRDARIIEGVANSADTSAWLKLPVGEALATAGVGMPLGSVADPAVEAQNFHQEAVQRRFVAVGEQVCAVQYRKVRFKWFSSRDLDKTSLEKNSRWKVYWNVRGQEIGTNDVVEADLQDELELEDHERYVYDTEQFLI
ncbi:hypothetical protein N7474_006122 [Penicillium riverlandense]|uniref:uncharacterized protein n=1 Tax=Penicillium riverlandense TaxID=1903569 RepID=UPI00254682F2|nr:uncharacterized protein N7474_006122 [Penicillium riverlandense]KAJ5820531.1 hypothetical protein N7474_006122 [Penicillium riverlandense]